MLLRGRLLLRHAFSCRASISVQAWLVGTMALLAGTAVVLALAIVLSQRQTARHAEATGQRTELLRLALAAKEVLAAEGSAYRALANGAHADAAEGRAARACTDATLAMLTARAATAPLKSAAMLRERLVGASTALGEVRAGIDAALGQPLAAAAIDRLREVIERVDQVADQVEVVTATATDPLLRSYIVIVARASDVQDALGRLEAGMAQAGGDRRLNPAPDLGRLQGRLDLAWENLAAAEAVAERVATFHDVSAVGALGAAISAARRSYGADQSSTLLGQGAQQALARIRDQAAAEVQALARAERRAALGTLAILAAIATLATAIAAWAILRVRGRIIKPMTTVTRAVMRLADGTFEPAVPIVCSVDEVGRLAQAVEALRRAALRADAIEREHRALEAQMHQAQKFEALGTLAAGITHEINSPLQYLNDTVVFLKDGFAALGPVLDRQAELVAAAAGDPRLAAAAAAATAAADEADLEFVRAELAGALAQAQEGVHRIRDVVQAVKRFAHPDTGELRPLDLNLAINQAVTLSRGEWKHVATVTTDLAPDMPPVPCLAGELSQVMLNLIVNAAHAIEAKGAGIGHIAIATADQGDWVELSIADTGTGIPPDLLDRIYDPFFTTKEPGKGTGQGLAICRRIVVDRHGGTIQVDSRPGAGATFVIRLPRRPTADAGARELAA